LTTIVAFNHDRSHDHISTGNTTLTCFDRSAEFHIEIPILNR
jgi:hypothetical protein